MKCRNILLCLLLPGFFHSCSTNDDDGFTPTGITRGPYIAVSNWTGHPNRICSPGETLLFTVTKRGNAQEFELAPDTGATYYDDLEEGDLLEIQVRRKDGEILHQRTRQFTPSDPDRPSPDLNRTPIIQVCEIGRLDLLGF